jgi:hypothetical protein
MTQTFDPNQISAEYVEPTPEPAPAADPLATPDAVEQLPPGINGDDIDIDAVEAQVIAVIEAREQELRELKQLKADVVARIHAADDALRTARRMRPRRRKSAPPQSPTP